MFLRFRGLVTQENGSEMIEYVDAKNFAAAQDYFETLYGEKFTGELREVEEEKSAE